MADKARRVSRAAIGIAILAMVAGPSRAASPPQRPNLLIIVADDLGYADLGAFGGEIDTPNLDAIARSGVRFTGFHAAPTCSPSRAMLLTGTDNHLAGLGNMAEMLAPNQIGHAGYEGHLRGDAVTLAERLAASGYRTMMAGKWHLGDAPGQGPESRGFQHSFAMLQAAHNHFGKDVSSDPDRRSNYRRDGIALHTLPADFYSSDAFTSSLIGQLQTTRAGPEGSKPFFAYLAFTAPHFPLQAPAPVIAKYKGRYDEGYDVIRERRLARQRALGLLAPGTPVRAITRARPWNQLDAAERQLQARKMEIYAAMVHRMDQNVGRLVQVLKDTGEYEHTIILFLADNGAESVDAQIAPSPIMRRNWQSADQRLDAIGGAASFATYGPGWAQAGTAPSWLYKSSTAEGGTRVPAFIAGNGIGNAGAIEDAFVSVMDVVPTFLDLARAPRARAKFNGDQVQPVMGRSWVAWIRGGTKSVYGPGDAVGTQMFSGRSLRQGDWKLTDIGDGRWLLFDVATDPGETRDMSAQEPRRWRNLVKAYERYRKSVGVIMPDPPIPPR